MDLTQRDLLAKTLQAEAGNQGYNGMVAVGSVIMNRLAGGSDLGKSFCSRVISLRGTASLVMLVVSKVKTWTLRQVQGRMK